MDRSPRQFDRADLQKAIDKNGQEVQWGVGRGNIALKINAKGKWSLRSDYRGEVIDDCHGFSHEG